jgi:hypothetical protein
VKIIDGACFVSMQLLTLNINFLMAQFLTIMEKKKEIKFPLWNNKPLKFKQSSYLKIYAMLFYYKRHECFEQLRLIIFG